ncbi:MAG TPA: DUF6683 family protein, partial [Edaphobacter sp.]|nr:DUF6683 family protein [Edaphobacter sp.]
TSDAGAREQKDRPYELVRPWRLLLFHDKNRGVFVHGFVRTASAGWDGGGRMDLSGSIAGRLRVSRITTPTVVTLMRPASRIVILLLAIGAFVSAHAQAVVPPPSSFLTGGFVGSNGAVRDAMISATTGAAHGRKGSTGAATQSLSFQGTQAVTRAVNQKLVDAISEQQPSVRPRAEKLFRSGVLTRTFDDLLAKYGYSPNNLADVMTAYLVLSWETVHNGDATRYPQGIEAVHEQMRDALAANPQVARFDDAQKQEMAETLADLAMMSTIARKQLLKSGDTARLQQLEENVRKNVLVFGVDLGTVSLTNRGFAPVAVPSH